MAIKVKHRKSLQTEFCFHNPEACNKNSCSTNKNFALLRSDISDIDKIQGCMFKGVGNSIKTILATIISDQREVFKEDFNMSDTTLKIITDETFQKVHTCVDQKIKNHTKNNTYRESFLKNAEPLFHINSNQFTEAIILCTKSIESNMAQVFATLLISNIDTVKNLSENNGKQSFYNEILNKGALNFAEKTTKKSIESCIEAQLEHTGLVKISVAACRPLVEMYTAKEVIAASLSKGLTAANIPILNNRALVNEYNTCANTAITRTENDMYNKNSKSPILDAKTANDYLSNNHEFYGCIKNSISRASKIMAKQGVTALYDEFNKDLISPEYLLELRPKITTIIQSCFDKKLNKIKSWPDFITANEEDFLKKTEKECTQAATEYTLPKIMIKEVGHILTPLNSSTISDLNLTKVTTDLKRKYGISLPAEKHEEILKLSYRRFLIRNPNKKVEDFIQSFVDSTQLSIVENIKNGIVEGIIEKDKGFNNLENLRADLSSQCLNDIYNLHKDSLALLITRINAMPKTDEPKVGLKTYFIDLLHNGFIHARSNNQYDDYIKKLNMACSNSKDLDKLSDLVDTNLGDDILISEIGTQVKTAFSGIAMEQCYDELKIMKIRISDKSAGILCSLNKVSEDDLDSLILNSSPKSDGVYLNFIGSRKNDSLDLVAKNFTEAKVQKLFGKNRNVLDYIYGNFSDIITNDSQKKEKLVIMAMENIFDDRSNNSFASDFIEIQLVAAIGLGGYKEAITEVNNNIDQLGVVDSLFSDRIVIKAKSSLDARWKPGGIKYYLNWKNLSEDKKRELTSSVINMNIFPRMNALVSKDESTKLAKNLRDKVVNHLSTHKVFENPEYKSKDKKSVTLRGVPLVIPSNNSEKLSFIEMLSHDITKEVTSSVKSDVYDDVINIIFD